MINVLLVLVGIVLMVYSVLKCIQLRRITSEINVSSTMGVILFLICFFLFGYIIYAIYLINQTDFQPIHTLISLILFFGSVFVFIVKRSNYTFITTLSKKNKEIEENNSQLAAKQQELEEIKVELEKKNVELGQALDDFYALKIDSDKITKDAQQTSS